MLNLERLRGVYTALVTPFINSNIDEEAFTGLVERQIQNGISGIVPTGTTGEAVTLSFDEQYRVIELAVTKAAGRVPVIAGVGSNNTREAMQNIIEAEARGVDGLLIVTPYYNKPTQEGLYRHYMELANIATTPIILYNVPSRTGVNLEPTTVTHLANNSAVVGIKEASGSMRQIQEIFARCPKDFLVYSGDDSLNFSIYCLGGAGSISVTANIAPRDVSRVWQTFTDVNLVEARRIHNHLETLNQILFIETNPIPTKTALSLLGLIQSEVRLPLCELLETNKEKLIQALRNYQLL